MDIISIPNFLSTRQWQIKAVEDGFFVVALIGAILKSLLNILYGKKYLFEFFNIPILGTYTF